jgi:UDP-glucuronate 4-epimerase
MLVSMWLRTGQRPAPPIKWRRIGAANSTTTPSDNTATPNPAWDGATPDPGTSSAPYRLFNIGNNNPVKLTDFISAIEQALGKTAERELLPMQPGDVASTYADIDDLIEAVDYRPQTPVQVGIDNFVTWYMDYMR